MRLILKEYLSSLRERNELDAILQDLLSQMGLDVFIRPSPGHKEFGVDIAAVGAVKDDIERVYLFSVKAGDLDGRDWDGDSNQALRQSLNEIKDVFIPTFMPSEHEGKPIVICSCYGGDLKRSISANVSQYEKQNTSENISYSRWDGEKLSSLIEQHFLREDLLPKEFRGLLRKSLALLDEPESSYHFFKELVSLIFSKKAKPKDDLKSLRQLNICLRILYSWCREQGNVESAYLSSELAILHSWEYAKKYRGDKKKASNLILESIGSIHELYQRISSELIENKVFKKASTLYSLSFEINSSNPLDINLKLFDILGRVSLSGLWSYWFINHLYSDDETKEQATKMYAELQSYRKTLISLIANNPLLFTPYKDDHAIDIALTAWFLSVTGEDVNDLHNWLFNIVDYTEYLFISDGRYPCSLNSYHELLNHPIKDSPKYLHKVTAGSILYPYISLIAAVHGFDDIYDKVKSLKQKYLDHTNFQIWYPSKSTEDKLYTNKGNHGLTFSDVPIDQSPEEYLKTIFKECEHFNFFEEISASYCWPIIFTACRHHRIPVPIDFFYDLYNKQNNESNKSGNE
jgi:hypothetical protein